MTPDEEQAERRREQRRASFKRYRERHPERARAHVHNWAKNHPRDLREYMKEYHQRPEVKERHRIWAQQNARTKVIAAYGITPDDYDLLLAKQDGGCAICGGVPNYALGIDHEHGNGLVRGLLCRACNSAIGMFGEDVKRIERAASYLRRELLDPIEPHYLPPAEGFSPRCSFARPNAGYQCAHKTNHPTGRCWRHRDGR